MQYQLSSFTFLSFDGSKYHVFFFVGFAWLSRGVCSTNFHSSKKKFTLNSDMYTTECQNLPMLTDRSIVMMFTKANYHIKSYFYHNIMKQYCGVISKSFDNHHACQWFSLWKIPLSLGMYICICVTVWYRLLECRVMCISIGVSVSVTVRVSVKQYRRRITAMYYDWTALNVKWQLMMADVCVSVWRSFGYIESFHGNEVTRKFSANKPKLLLNNYYCVRTVPLRTLSNDWIL